MQQSVNLSEVRAFVALAEGGSFAAAGRTLGRDPTVLSRSVQALERRIGVRLAHRSTRAMTLTEAGTAYLARVKAILAELEAAERDVSGLGAGEPHGRLRVALPGSFARLWMAPMITEFLKTYPKVVLEVDYTNQLVDVIGRGIDLAVRLAELSDSRLVARKVASRRRLLCAAPSYLADRDPLRHPKDVPKHDCLCFTGRNDPYRWSFQQQSGAQSSVVVEGRISSNDADILVEAAVAGLGLFYTTDWHVGPLLRSGQLKEVMTNWPVVDRGGIYIVTSAASGLSVTSRALSNWFAKELKKQPWVR